MVIGVVRIGPMVRPNRPNLTGLLEATSKGLVSTRWIVLAEPMTKTAHTLTVVAVGLTGNSSWP